MHLHSVSGANTRRYHGLLVAATHPPVGRLVMLSKLEDALLVDGERFELSTNVYGDDVVHPHGYRNLRQFRLDPFPVYTYASERFVLEKSIFMPRGQNTVVVEYILTAAAGGVGRSSRDFSAHCLSRLSRHHPSESCSRSDGRPIRRFGQIEAIPGSAGALSRA